MLGVDYGRSEYSIQQELTGMGIQLSLDEVGSFTVSYCRILRGYLNGGGPPPRNSGAPTFVEQIVESG